MKEALCKVIAWWKEQSPSEKILIMLAIGVFLVLISYLYCAVIEGEGQVLGPANQNSTLALAYFDIKGAFLKAIDRDGTRTLIVLLAGIVGWIYLSRRTIAAERNANTESFIQAMNQLASDSPSIRTGGILSLEQIVESQESERDKIIRILSARIRELAPKTEKTNPEDRAKRLDIETAVKALVRIAEGIGARKLELCDLQETDLRGLNFRKDDLSFFTFKSAELTKAGLWEANLTEARLSKVNLAEANLWNANLAEADLQKANLAKAELWEANLAEADLRKANLTEASLWDANLTEASLSGANLAKAELWEANLTEAKLYRANLTEANLWDANLTEASLSGANLTEASLLGANLTEARLSKVNLTGVLLDGVDFTRASLDKANLSDAQFGESGDHEEYKLLGGKLGEVRGLTQEQLDEAYYWTGHPPMGLPNGLNPPPERTPPEENDQD